MSYKSFTHGIRFAFGDVGDQPGYLVQDVSRNELAQRAFRAKLALAAIMKPCVLIFFVLCPLLVTAQLAVTISPPKITGQKAIVILALTNQLAEKVESARAVCLLLDDQGKLIGQSTKWVIGQNHADLEPKSGTTFNFVIRKPQPRTSTNLAAQVIFSRVVLEGGKLADVRHDVIVTSAAK